MSSIDERVVKMRLDNSQFEQGVSKSSSLLGKLKQALNLDKSVESINNVDKAVSGVSFNPLTSGLQSVQSGFNAMGAVAFSVLNRMTNAAIDAGSSITNALTASVRDGFAEYETQMGSVQTILSNTMSKGTNLDQVNSALDTLNTYADKTIYNFTEMTRNIGTFTAAGVDLQTSVDSIKGIANLAAASGSSSAQAASAMYQLSQALAAGKIQLMDWNSVVNAGMGGELFQNALKRTAENFGTDVDGMIKKYGSFRESLTKGEWLTAEVMTETLKQISGAYTESDLIAQGYSEQQAKDIVKLAQTAEDAATKVKTFTQLLDTTKEALGSGWTQSWEIIIGDFEESKDLWTGISDQIGNIVNTASNARNELLSSGLSSGWKQLLNEGIADTAGFQEIMTQTARDHGVAIDDMISKNGSFTKSMSEGWVTADIVSESVKKMTDKMSAMSQEELQASGYTSENVEQIKNLNEQLQNGSLSAQEFADKMNRMSGRENVIAGLANVFGDLGKIFKRIGQAYREVFPAMTGDELYTLTERFKEFTKTLTPSEQTLDRIGRIAKGVFSVFDIGVQAVKAVGNAIATAFGSDNMGSLLDNLLDIAAGFGDWLVGLDNSIKQFGIFDGAAKVVGTEVSRVLGIFSSFTGGISSMGSSVKSIASTIGDVLGGAFERVKNIISDVLTWITDNISGGDIFAGLTGGGIFLAAQKIGGAFDKIKETVEGIFGNGGENLKKGAGVFGEILDGLQESLNAFTGGVKAFTLVEIAGSIALLVNSMEKIAALSGGEVVGGISAIGGLMTELNISLKSISKTMKGVKTTDLIKTGAALMEFAKAVDMLANAMSTIGNLDWDEIGKGLTGMGGAMAELIAAAKGLSYAKVNIKTAGSLIAMAQAVKMVADPLKQLGGMSWEEIGKGLSAMGGAIAEMGTVTGLLGRFGKNNLSASVSMVLTAKSLGDIADAFGDFSKYDWDEIGRGLVAMGGALAEVGTVTGALGKLAGFSGILGGGSILITAQSLDEIAKAFNSFTQYNWDKIGRGLTAMGGALGEVGLVTGALGKLAGFSGILGGGSILITAQSLGDIASAFRSFTQYNWDEIGRGLAAMGGALGEVGLVTGSLGKLAGLSGIIGGGSILITAKSLGDIASAFNSFTQYNWGEIGRGLVAMGGALGEVGLITGALGKLAGLSGLIGAGTITLAVQGLDEIARAFNLFAQYSWDEIGRGLVAMGGALGEVAVISGATGTLTGIAGLMGAGTITLASQGLIDLATAFGKFAEFNWDEIGRGLAAMGGAMGETALGGLLNTFSGFGAGAISEMAVPLGQLADSVKKWSGVTVPDNLADNMAQLANGVKQFTFGGLGAGALSTAAPGMVQMANAVAKWSTIEFPAGIEGNLTALANGVKAFTLAFAGGWSIGAINEPLGNLAGSVKKWNGVTIPGGIQGNLTALANGVKAFSLAFVGGWSLGAIIEPLGKLAGSVKKWNGVTIPGGIQGNLTALANGVKAFTGIGSGIAESMSSVSTSLNALANSVRNLAGSGIATIGTLIQSMVNSINSASGITSALPQQMATFSSQLGSAISTAAATVSSGVSGIIANINAMSAQFGNAGTQLSISLVRSIASGLALNQIRAMNAMSTLCEAMIYQAQQTFNGAMNKFREFGVKMVDNVVSGMNSKKSAAYDSGADTIQGFINGMNSKRQLTINTAASIASAALDAAKRASGVASPSWKYAQMAEFCVDGIVNGFNDNKSNAVDAVVGVVNSMNSMYDNKLGAMSRDANSFKFTPNISPVMDLNAMSSKSVRGSLRLDPSSVFDTSDTMFQVEKQRSLRLDTSRQMKVDNSDVVKAVEDVTKQVGILGQQVTNMKMVMDSGAMVGALASKMDRKLGRSAAYKERGI